MDDSIQKDGTRKQSQPIQKNQRPTRRKKPLTIWERIAKVFKVAADNGKSINRNKIYAQYGVGTGSPIYTPQRKKLKGYQKDHKGNKIRYIIILFAIVSFTGCEKFEDPIDLQDRRRDTVVYDPKDYAPERDTTSIPDTLTIRRRR